MPADQDGSESAAVAAMNGMSVNGMSVNGMSVNGMSLNGMSVNGMSVNGMSVNGMSVNGMSVNGLATAGGLSSSYGLMTTEGGRDIVKYMVKCAFPAGHNLVKQDQYGNFYTFEGGIGVAPELEFGLCDLDCQERISGCMLAHVNNSGLHVSIWLVGPDAGIGWGSSPDYPYMEAAYFGNLFATNMPGYYCAGKNMAAGDAKGRLGSPFGNNNNVLTSPYGWQWDGASNQNVPYYCVSAGATYCQPQNEGYSSCIDPMPSSPYSPGHAWTHPVTVYRNFETTQLYKICNKNGGKCLGVVGGSTADGANIEQRTYTGAAGQTWQIIQVSPGVYKIINKTSGKSIDVSGTQVVQKTYTGAPSQLVPLTYFADQPGFANLKVSNNSNVFWTNWSTADGALIQTTNQTSADPAKWSFTAISSATFDPGRSVRLVPQHATTKSVDVPVASQANGTAVQQYDSFNMDSQKFFIRDAANGNMKIAMRVNPNKCIGPRANGTVAGTRIEVQDCNGSFNQAWITSELSAGSGIVTFKNAAAPNLCLDVLGGSTFNGATLDLSTCNGANNQKFAVQAAP